MPDVPSIPLAEKVNEIVFFLRTEYRSFFRSISESLKDLVEGFENVLLSNEFVVLGVLVALGLVAGSKRGWLAGALFGLFTALGFGLMLNLDLWEATMRTLALVLAAGVVSIVAGIPLGVAMARFEWVNKVVRPVLDFMQTMPAFVYLLPAVSFFSVGVVSALFATVIFAIPPIVRLTAHGIEHVDKEVVEASEAFGANTWQTLVKVQVPLARPSIMVGVNQTLMLSLSMVVIAALVGAPGLGSIVVEGLSTGDTGRGFEGGIGIVILAVVLDRITQALGSAREPGKRSALVEFAVDPVRRLLGGLVSSKTAYSDK